MADITNEAEMDQLAQDWAAKSSVTYIRIAHDCRAVSWFEGVHKDLGADIRLTLENGKIVKAEVVDD